MEGSPIKLMDGGAQKRCFTDINDGIEALFRIIENRDGLCDGQIVNIGNPTNEASIRELAEMLLESFNNHPLRDRFPPFAGFRTLRAAATTVKVTRTLSTARRASRTLTACWAGSRPSR